MTESFAKWFMADWMREREVYACVLGPLCNILFTENPSEDSVAKILSDGYVEVTDTRKANDLMRNNGQFHKIGKARVFIREK